MQPKGGTREGAGRKPSSNPANKMISVKLTQEQYAKWVAIGASRWLKRKLDEQKDDLTWKIFAESLDK